MADNKIESDRHAKFALSGLLGVRVTDVHVQLFNRLAPGSYDLLVKASVLQHEIFEEILALNREINNEAFFARSNFLDVHAHETNDNWVLSSHKYVGLSRLAQVFIDQITTGGPFAAKMQNLCKRMDSLAETLNPESKGSIAFVVKQRGARLGRVDEAVAVLECAGIVDEQTVVDLMFDRSQEVWDLVHSFRDLVGCCRYFAEGQEDFTTSQTYQLGDDNEGKIILNAETQRWDPKFLGNLTFKTKSVFQWLDRIQEPNPVVAIPNVPNKLHGILNELRVLIEAYEHPVPEKVELLNPPNERITRGRPRSLSEFKQQLTSKAPWTESELAEIQRILDEAAAIEAEVHALGEVFKSFSVNVKAMLGRAADVSHTSGLTMNYASFDQMEPHSTSSFGLEGLQGPHVDLTLDPQTVVL